MNREIIPYNKLLNPLAKLLRKRMTFSEVILWNHLKNFQMMGYDFDRQRPILNFIVDFYCKDLRLVIEVDGITHLNESAYSKDLIRDDAMKEYDIAIIRLDALKVVNQTAESVKIIENWIVDFELTHPTHPTYPTYPTYPTHPPRHSLARATPPRRG